MSIFEFLERFPDERSCYGYLSELKWANGYKCPKCGNTKYCGGLKEFDRQCTRCYYLESPTSGTLFHKVKFSTLKAFWIVYYVSTSKKGIFSTELSRKLELRQKTCWLFKQKVMQAMSSSNRHPLSGRVEEVDEFVVGQQEEGVIGRKNKSKKLAIIAIERDKGGVKRIYAQKIDKVDKKTVEAFNKSKVSNDAEIRSDGFSAYRSLTKQMPNLIVEKSKKKGRILTLSIG